MSSLDQDLVPCPCCGHDETLLNVDLGCYLCAGLLGEHEIHRNPWPPRTVPVLLAIECSLVNPTDKITNLLLYMRHGGVWPEGEVPPSMLSPEDLPALWETFLSHGIRPPYT